MVIQFPREKYTVLDRREDMVDELFTEFTKKCLEYGCSLEDDEFLVNAGQVLQTMRCLVDGQLGLQFESTSEEQC